MSATVLQTYDMYNEEEIAEKLDVLLTHFKTV